MGLATAGFLARIFRSSRFGHQSRFGSPLVGGVRPCTTGQLPPPLSGVAPSVTTGSWFSDMEKSFRKLGGSGAFRNFEWRATGAQAPVGHFCLIDRVAAIVRGDEARRLANGAVDVFDHAARPAHDVMVVVPDPRLIAGQG